ncbi:glycosyl transferase family protein [Candidatus Moduliflexus flocculans]|uniref:Glycosyl transferase family protein n=1 Tax=Candidatus Moduliflexus flocculans TaxID=1499966 RepID=A0A081BL93_9BACT|nr:glycosyl transferase family protein [Candidatus Moduliflexus flocculans]
MNLNQFWQRPLIKANLLLAAFAGANFLLYLFATIIGRRSGYGYFIDEFYYIACAKRLAFGYVDHPPLAPFLLRLVLATLGDSLLAIRVLPALANALSLVLTGLIARRLGAGVFGQFLAALAMAVAPIFLVLAGFFSMNPLETLLWSACGYLLITLIQEDRPKLWLAIGALFGLGLMNKHTLIVYISGLLIGMLFTPARIALRNRWFWAGMLLGALIVLPNIVWQIQHGFPSLDFYRNAAQFKNIDSSPVKVILDQILSMNPITAPIWLSGLLFFLAARRGKTYRMFGVMYLILLSVMFASHSSRPDRMLAAYPALFAAGAYLIEQGLKSSRLRNGGQITIVALLLIAWLPLLPFSLPLLPPETMNAVPSPVQIEAGVNSRLPQWLADRFGWEELVTRVANVYETLSPEERAKCAIVAGNYGQAGAVELFGKAYHLPPVISGHNTYWLWGTGDYTGEVAIILGGNSAELRNVFQEVKTATLAECAFCRPDLKIVPIYVAKGLKLPVTTAWARAKSYD